MITVEGVTAGLALGIPFGLACYGLLVEAWAKNVCVVRGHTWSTWSLFDMRRHTLVSGRGCLVCPATEVMQDDGTYGLPNILRRDSRADLRPVR